MKKILLPILGLLLTAGITMAQEKGSIRVGAGIVYGSKGGVDGSGSEKGGYGLGIGAEYFLTNNIAIAPGFNYFMKSTIAGSNSFGEYKGSVKYNTIDLDGRYYLGIGNFDFYGMVGLSMASSRVKMEFEGENGNFNEDETDRDLGLNIGAGVVYPLSERFGINGQVKFNTPMQQVAIQAGVIYAIK